MKKSRILAVVMSVLMMISMLPTMVFAAETSFGELSGELKIKGAPALDITLSADYKKVKPEGLTDDYVSFLWERKLSDSEEEALVELSREKTYKVTAEDVGYKIVLTITGIEEKGVTGELKVTSKEVTETVPEEYLMEETASEELLTEEIVQEEAPTEEEIEEAISVDETVLEEVPAEEVPSETDLNEELIEETLVNEEVYDTGVDEELTQTPEPGTDDSEETEEELMPLNESESDESIQEDVPSYAAEAVTPDESGTVNFGTVDSSAIGETEAKTVTVKNTGSGALNFEGISPEHFMVQDITETLEAGDEVSLWIVPREGLAAGTYEDTITYTSIEGAAASYRATVTVQESKEEASEENDPDENLIDETISEELNMDSEPLNEEKEEENTEVSDNPEKTDEGSTGTGDTENTDNENTDTPTPEPERTAVTADVDVLEFDAVTEGYEEAPAPRTVVLTNAGNTDVTLAQPVTENDYYIIGDLSRTTLAPGENAEFTVQPKTGLEVNSYPEVISVVNGADGSDLCFITVAFEVEQMTKHILTVIPENLDFGTVEEGYETAPKALTVSVTNDGNVPETLGQPVSDRFVISELSSYELKPGETSTFTVQPKTGLTESITEEITVPNDTETAASFFASIVVTAKKDTSVKLLTVRKPGEITGLENGISKKAESFRLPSTVVIETSNGEMKASVVWDVKGCAYDPSSTSAQSFNVKGTVTLPDGVTNPDNISLVTSVKVTVNAYSASVVSADGNQITGITPNGQYTTKSTISFTAVGAGMDNKSPRKGDIRYLPLNWTVINTNTWTGAPYAASFGMGRSGDYSLTVAFNRQKYDGSNWVNTGEQDTKKVSFSVVQAADPTVTPTPGANQRRAVQTGDDTPILPFVIVLIIAVVCIGGILVYRRKKK